MLTLLIAAHPTNVAIFSAFVYSTHILYDHQGDFQHAAKTIGDHAEKSLPIEPFLGYVKSRFMNSGAGPGFMLFWRATRGHSLSLPSQRPVLLAQPSQRSVKMLRLEVGPQRV